jgi:hypothetical protein
MVEQPAVCFAFHKDRMEWIKANWQFALLPIKTTWSGSKQTASLLYRRAAIFIISRRRIAT